jgi:hypothetical protein
MRIPLGLLAIPVLVLGVCGSLVSPEPVIRFIDAMTHQTPLTMRLESFVPYVVGNRSVGEIAITCFTLLVLKQCMDYFEKS